jgi:hypothetical protein
MERWNTHIIPWAQASKRRNMSIGIKVMLVAITCYSFELVSFSPQDKTLYFFDFYHLEKSVNHRESSLIRGKAFTWCFYSLSKWLMPCKTIIFFSTVGGWKKLGPLFCSCRSHYAGLFQHCLKIPSPCCRYLITSSSLQSHILHFNPIKIHTIPHKLHNHPDSNVLSVFQILPFAPKRHPNLPPKYRLHPGALPQKWTKVHRQTRFQCVSPVTPSRRIRWHRASVIMRW